MRDLIIYYHKLKKNELKKNLKNLKKKKKNRKKGGMFILTLPSKKISSAAGIKKKFPILKKICNRLLVRYKNGVYSIWEKLCLSDIETL